VYRTNPFTSDISSVQLYLKGLVGELIVVLVWSILRELIM
jgi:hypothetical protein